MFCGCLLICRGKYTVVRASEKIETTIKNEIQDGNGLIHRSLISGILSLSIILGSISIILGSISIILGSISIIQGLISVIQGLISVIQGLISII